MATASRELSPPALYALASRVWKPLENAAPKWRHSTDRTIARSRSNLPHRSRHFYYPAAFERLFYWPAGKGKKGIMFSPWFVIVILAMIALAVVVVLNPGNQNVAFVAIGLMLLITFVALFRIGR